MTKIACQNGVVVAYNGARIVWQEQASAVSAPTQQARKAAVQKRFVQAKSGAVMREQPTKESRTLAVLPQETAVDVLHETAGWVHVAVNGQHGYMMSDKLR